MINILLTLTKRTRNGTGLIKFSKCRNLLTLDAPFLAMLNDLARLVCVHMRTEPCVRHQEQRYRNAHLMKVIDNDPAQYYGVHLDAVAEAPAVTEAPKNRYERLENRISLFNLLSAF